MALIPVELVDLIMSSLIHPIQLKPGNGEKNFLDRHTVVTLGNCAMVCRLWVSSSRRVLFYRIRISQNSVPRLVDLFHVPHRLTFLPFVRELQVLYRRAENGSMHAVLERIAKHLPSIRTLVLSVPDLLWEQLRWPPLTAITRLEIEHRYSPVIADIVRCLESFPALEAAKIWLGEPGTMTLPMDPLSLPESLRSLDLRYAPGLEPLLGWIETNSGAISALRLCFPSRTTQAHLYHAAEYIETLGPSLTSLSLVFSWSNPLFGKYLRRFGVSTVSSLPAVDVPAQFLQRNVNLEMLSLHGTASQVVSLLKKAQFFPVFRRVNIVGPIDAAWFNLPGPFSWEDLDAVVSPLPFVEQLDIAYFGIDSSTTLDKQLNHILSRHRLLPKLPLCVARGIVTENVVLNEYLRWL
jgi:hypothetical protein